VLGVLNNVNPHTDQEAKVSIDVVLAAWGAMNVVVNVLIARVTSRASSSACRP